MSCIRYFVQALQSMTQIIRNFTRSVGSTTGVVASVMVTPGFKQVAYLYYTPLENLIQLESLRYLLFQ